ncbi:MAG: primase [Frankiales bacterium]|jgi:DNA primase|nr:primase [Frankiales bacterium]
MAGRISDVDIARVREESPIADIVGEHLQLRNAGGGSLKGLCPFHDEKTPSFHVTPARGYFHCFGCQVGGDVISFVQQIDHLTFTEAIERLAARAGVELHYEQGGSAARPQQGDRQRLVLAHAAAAEFYSEQLTTPGALVGREFLDQRGFDQAAAEQFSVGFAPDDWDQLVVHLRGRGFTDKELLVGGLAREGQRGPIDRFRGRLLWPIRDITGDVIGFGARRLLDSDPVQAKYLNTPDTPLYKKSTVLYGVDLAKRDIARQMRAVVVEGYTDVMACHLAGVPTAVASCGTAFGSDHIKVLRRLLMDQDEFRGEVIFTFDGDEAGRKAALRAFQDDQQFVAQTFVAVQPDGLDPCDLRLKHGDLAVRDLVANRKPMFEFAIRSVLDSYDLESAEGRTAARRATMNIVRDIRAVDLRKEYARRLAGWLGVSDPNEMVAEARGDVIDVRRSTRSPVAARPDPRDPGLQIEREAAKLAVQRPALVGPVFDAVDAEVFTAPAYAMIRTAVAAAGGTTSATGGEAWVTALLEHAPDDTARSLITELAVEPLRATTDDDPRYAGAVLARLRELQATRLIAELKGRLQRVNPVEEAENYNRMFGELVALEQHRRGLREQGLAEL